MEEELNNKTTFDFDTTDAKNREESSQFELDELENYPLLLLSPGPGIPD